MVNMIDHEIESKETGRIEIGIEMTLVMYIWPHVSYKERMVI